MQQFFNSIAFKIGVFIILAEVTVLSVGGFVYNSRFADQVDRRIAAQVQIPGKLIQAGRMSPTVVVDREAIGQLVGEEIIKAMIVGVDGEVVFSSDSADAGENVAAIPGVDDSLFDAGNPKSEVIFESDTVVYVSPIFSPDGAILQYYLYIKAGTGESEAEKAAMVSLFILGSVAAIILTSAIIFLSFKAAILDPVSNVLAMIRQVESGNLSVQIPGEFAKDEIGDLKRGVNSMAAQLEELVNNLERRVRERTQRLEVVATLGERLNAILYPEELLVEVIRLVEDNLSYYAVSIWLVVGELLVVRAASSRLKADIASNGKTVALDSEKSLIARAARTAEVAIVNDIHQADDWMPCASLPDTRAEIAVPMINEGKVIGVLDVQEDHSGAFSSSEVDVFRSLANQMGVALHNASLYTEMERLVAERTAELVAANQALVNELQEREAMEEALRRSEKRFRAIVEDQTDLIVRYRHDGTITYANENYCRFFRYSPDDLIGRNILDLVQEKDREVSEQDIRAITPENPVTSNQERDYVIDEEIHWILWNDRGMFDEDDRLIEIQAVGRNITERKQVEEMLRESQKFADLGTLAAGMAHEINSPLQVITGMSESISRQLDQDRLDHERLPDYIENINRNAWRISKIVRSMLIYARPAMEGATPHDLSEIVEDTLLLTEHRMKTWMNIKIEKELAEDLPQLLCDRNQITQVVINLLTNAADAMLDGGVISIHTSYNEAKERFLLEVSDTGPGIPEEVRGRIFDPFFTTKPVGKGTGLGLSIVMSIVQAHGGEIKVGENPRGGTRISVYFKNKPPHTPVELTKEQGRYS